MLISKDKLNLLSLISIQASNAVLPLILFPYLLVTIGAELFSKLVIAEIISVIILTIIIYGYEIDGVKRIAAIQQNFQQLSIVFNEILIARFLLFFLSLISLPLLFIFYDTETFLFILSWLLIPFSYILQNSYFFLAVQDNFLPAIFNIASRVIALLATFLLIKTSAEGIYAPLVIGVSYLCGSIATVIYLAGKYHIKPERVNISKCCASLAENFHIFLSNASVLLYRDLNVLILSLTVKDPSIISSYSIAEKFVKSLQAVCRPLSQFYFSKVVLQLKDYLEPNKSTFLIILRSTFPQLAIFSLLLIAVAIANQINRTYQIIPLEHNTPLIAIFLLMTTSVFFGISNFMFGSVGLNILGKRKYFALCVLLVGIANLIICTLLSFYLEAWGAAISFILAEVFLFILVSLIYFRKQT
ncbi:MAG TPA: oligosaccharide flippase family protein [Cellvibrio sp.]|nr:oligosaccharide flippase family protein [Cellvibrio sp.]